MTQDTSTIGSALYICGDQSGVGKTSVSLALLNALLAIYQPEEIAYIKPCTQCEDVQLLWKWCHLMGITCHGIGPILYKPGFTQKCIDKDLNPDDPALEDIPTREERYTLISNAVNTLRKQYKFVLVDGVGYPAVGSCIGCSNGQVARLLEIPTLMISRPGIGNSIDSCVMGVEYLAFHGVHVLGTIVNKIPNKVSYHTYDRVVEYVTKFFNNYTYNNPHISSTPQKIKVYGFVKAFSDDDGSCATSCAVSCTLKPNLDTTAFDLTMDDYDFKQSTQLLKAHRSVQYVELITDVNNYLGNPTPSPQTQAD